MSTDEAERLARLIAADRRHLWHPFTPMDEWESEDPPLIAERGEGAYLIDVEGERYLDGVSSLWVNIHGHRKEEIDEAVRAQLARIAHTTQLGMANPAAIELAEKLTQIAPAGLTRVFYSDSGATAVEIALKMAFQFQKAKKDPKTRERQVPDVKPRLPRRYGRRDITRRNRLVPPHLRAIVVPDHAGGGALLLLVPEGGRASALLRLRGR